MTVKEIINKLKKLDTYYMSVGGGCECCGSWVESQLDEYGNWIKVNDIKEIIKEYEEKNK